MTEQLYRVHEQVGGIYFTGLPLDIAQEFFDNMVEAGYEPIMQKIRMTDHPLTEEMIEEIAQFEPDLTEPLRLDRTNDMRAAYHLGDKERLDQVIAWLKENLQSWYLTPSGYSGHKIDVDEVVSDLKEAMCPQQQETTDDTPTD
jgi:hypothetical protein